ncbi:SAVED domain-containing protein [Longimicrobium terrae]|uniref:SMODS-associated and fused to various effectors domain-containing protein n=1 Tax=Longimicrobium terrae TaxID=1639882 RepID=A0A841H1J7_9BACT|nr:SAVED domain-containing protein [Longimicrobium terrae]MBB4637489.1 hypothetical protein [Longimicrobium terrae]MBB6071887.1 hypothetical protein [Longimicrobium terrae]NNC30435.1 SAVED domain-containing protein [Longimicrobium terrae]
MAEPSRAVKAARPTLPAGLQNELWARAAGRCEFRGCNELLYVDSLTHRHSNLGVISHIVAFSPKGPRGHETRSDLLQRDISNLILTCRTHGKIIDDRDKVADYPEELLLTFKREHEERIRMLTSIGPDARSHVLLVQAPIDGCGFSIDQARAFQALLPGYPADESAEIIDLCGITLPASSRGFFPVLASALSQQLQAVLRRRPAGADIRSLSVFALAPVPLLVHLGHELGDIRQVDLFQKHRSGESWTWRAEEQTADVYEVIRPESPDGDTEVAVVLSISEHVQPALVAPVLGSPGATYELRAHGAGPDFLSSRKRLEVFGYEFRKLLAEVRAAHGSRRRVHLVAAVPAPVAIEAGRSIRKFDPEFIVYEFDKRTLGYFPALTINPRTELLHD